ncbi:MAG: hypothetical protein GF416_07210 [Candidatus Altiarchaeales archaeon]|nr:hypothetical protein [Candidatus Altiarchaeales archaeon]MBD3416900.1 hypothetical protein [Candidatus Altiarchaeales archaeon]
MAKYVQKPQEAGLGGPAELPPREMTLDVLRRQLATESGAQVLGRCLRREKDFQVLKAGMSDPQLQSAVLAQAQNPDKLIAALDSEIQGGGMLVSTPKTRARRLAELIVESDRVAPEGQGMFRRMAEDQDGGGAEAVSRFFSTKSGQRTWKQLQNLVPPEDQASIGLYRQPAGLMAKGKHDSMRLLIASGPVDTHLLDSALEMEAPQRDAEITRLLQSDDVTTFRAVSEFFSSREKFDMFMSHTERPEHRKLLAERMAQCPDGTTWAFYNAVNTGYRGPDQLSEGGERLVTAMVERTDILTGRRMSLFPSKRFRGVCQTEADEVPYSMFNMSYVNLGGSPIQHDAGSQMVDEIKGRSGGLATGAKLIGTIAYSRWWDGREGRGDVPTTGFLTKLQARLDQEQSPQSHNMREQLGMFNRDPVGYARARET